MNRPTAPAPSRIAVFRALQLGDLLCVMPALRALRAAFPEATITLIGLPWARDFVDRFPYIDDFMAFPGYRGLPERVPVAQALPAFLRAARERRFDLAIQMHGSGELTNAIVRQFGARRVAGFEPPGSPPDSREVMLAWQADEHEILRYLRLVEAIGAPAQGDHLEFPIQPAERDECAQLTGRSLAGQAFVCIHPGARLRSRRWLPDRFAAVADAMAGAGLRVVLTGTADEAPLVDDVLGHMRMPAIDLCGRTTLGGLAAVVQCARLVVCNDTGMSHIAAAVRTPSVVISSGADVRRWRPLDESRHRMLWHATPCRPCAHERCPTGHECAAGVTVDEVMQSVRSALATGTAHAA